MTDIFISYSTSDSAFARMVHDQLQLLGVKPFLAELSIVEGSLWNDEIWKNLKEAKSVIFLASKAACQSPYINQEIGAAIGHGKTIVPVVWDMPPEDLPGWAKDFQAVDLAHPEAADLNVLLKHIADKIKLDSFWSWVILVALVAGFAWLMKK